MSNNKSIQKKIFEYSILIGVLVFVIIHAIVRKDNIAALISAICGITYTFLAGKGLPVCYLFGITGSSFYGFLAFQNAIWGNLLLYLGYYLPMQILGYFKWKKNLKKSKNEIIKIVLPKKEMKLLFLVLLILTGMVYLILLALNDTHPLLDSITTVFSIGGMYLTVRRAIEQWIFWMLVNTLSLIMWIDIALKGAKVFSTITMWAVYLFLAIYFYKEWRKELQN